MSPALVPTRPRTRFALLCGALLLWQVWRLLLTPYGLASTWTHRSDLTAVSTGGAGLTQEFYMEADGLDGLWVRPVVSGGGTSDWSTGHLIVTLGDVSDGTPRPLFRQVLDATRVVTGRGWLIAIPEIRSSRGHRYVVSITHASREPGDALHLQARRSDAHRSAPFVADGREQWGDLMFATTSQRATLPYWKDQVLRAWPAWMRSWWTIVTALVLFDLVLAAACARAVGLSGGGTLDAGARVAAVPNDHGDASDAGDAPRARALTLAVGAVSLVGVVGLLVALVPSAPVRVIRLSDHLAEARLETTWGALHQGFDVQAVAMGSRSQEAIVALPTSRLAWTVDVPRGALLLGHVAMRPDVWLKEGDGATLTVSVEAGGVRTELSRFTLVPFLVEAHRDFHLLRASLDPWSGQRVTLVFETDPERWGNAVNDVPMWVEPRIEWPRGARWGTARIVTAE